MAKLLTFSYFPLNKSISQSSYGNRQKIKRYLKIDVSPQIFGTRIPAGFCPKMTSRKKTSVYRNIYAHTHTVKELRLFVLWFDFVESKKQRVCATRIKIIKGCADRCVKYVSVRKRNVKLFFSVFYFVIDIFTYFIFKHFLSFFNRNYENVNNFAKN